MTARPIIIWGGLVILMFSGALFWAKDQDPLARKWFTLTPPNHNPVNCVVIYPRPLRPYPVIIYAHGSDDHLINDGDELRQMAELGLAAVAWEYSQTNETEFDAQLDELLHYVNRQHWAKTNAIAWMGFGSGANQLSDFIRQNPEPAPRLLVELSGRGLPETRIPGTNGLPQCPTLLVHGEQDEVFPVADTRRLASVLQAQGTPTDIRIIPRLAHDLRPERNVLFRAAGEYCRMSFDGTAAWKNYRSVSQWENKAIPLWLCWLPAAVWAGGGLAWSRRRNAVARIARTRRDVLLRCFAALLAAIALAITGIHVVVPHLTVTRGTLAVARKYLVLAGLRSDFEYLAVQPIWHQYQLKILLELVALTGYNRQLANWRLENGLYQNFVLSPVITGNPGESLDWRRSLWEEFYPRVRHESSLENAASIVVRHLRERVTIAEIPGLPHDVPAIWLEQITDPAGFEVIYVAALRSVGVPARLDPHKQAEFWTGSTWRPAPPPAVVTW